MGNTFGNSWLDGDVPTRQRMNWKSNISMEGGLISALDFTTNLQYRWAFGGNGNDSQGSNNLTGVNSPTFGIGVYGQCTVLNGTTQYYTLTTNPNFTGDFTVSGWVLLNTINARNPILANKNSGGTNGVAFIVDTDNTLKFWYSTAASDNFLSGTTALSAGVWYHVIWTRTGSTATIYLNGVQEVSGTISGSLLTQTTYIGATTSLGNYLAGKLDHLQYFNASITAAQAKQIYSDCHGGMIATCNNTGSGFTAGITYRRSAENTTWEQLIDDSYAQTITGVKTFSNANINLSNNTVTDTSTAVGDLAKSNGTKFLRFAKGGTAFQVLRVNSSASDLEYANCRFTELGRTQLGADGLTISVASLPTVKRLMVLAELKANASTSVSAAISFNNDRGTNYSYRYSENGAAEVAGTSTTLIGFHGGVLQASETVNLMMHISNDTANRKLAYISVARDGGNGAATAPIRLEGAATWDNTANQINRIDVFSANANNFLSGSRVTVYGAD